MSSNPLSLRKLIAKQTVLGAELLHTTGGGDLEPEDLWDDEHGSLEDVLEDLEEEDTQIGEIRTAQRRRTSTTPIPKKAAIP